MTQSLLAQQSLRLVHCKLTVMGLVAEFDDEEKIGKTPGVLDVRTLYISARELALCLEIILIP